MHVGTASVHSRKVGHKVSDTARQMGCMTQGTCCINKLMPFLFLTVCGVCDVDCPAAHLLS